MSCCTKPVATTTSPTRTPGPKPPATPVKIRRSTSKRVIKVVAVMLASLASAVYWWPSDPAHAVMVAVAVLIVTCPCALSLATPAARLSAAGAMARSGVLVRRLSALQNLAASVLDAQALLPRVQWPDDAVAHAGSLALAAGVDGVRADLVMLRAARASAALDGRDAVTVADVDAVAEWAASVGARVEWTPGLGLNGAVQTATERRLFVGRMGGDVESASSALAPIGAFTSLRLY